MAYATYEDLMDLTEDLLKTITQNVLQATTVEYQGTALDFGKKFERYGMEEAIVKFSKFKNKEDLRNRDRLIQYLKDERLPCDPKKSTGELIATIFEEQVEAQLIQPTFITHFPLDISPLSRKSDTDPFLVDRFELYVFGREVANAFSELNDPEDQKERFLKQVEAKNQGNEEATDMDEDYIRALEFGMPPTAGEGIGIDRLVMLLTDSPSIRDVILFPLMRPEH